MLNAARFDDQVAAIIRSVAEEAILPRFRQLLETEVEEKSPGELVTIADRDADIGAATAARLGGHFVGIDVAQKADADRAVSAACEEGSDQLERPSIRLGVAAARARLRTLAGGAVQCPP